MNTLRYYVTRVSFRQDVKYTSPVCFAVAQLKV